MNHVQHEPLFTDLTVTQSETIAGSDPKPSGGGPLLIYQGPSSANASFGSASATFARYSYGAFSTRLSIKDKAKDGYSVYALVQGKTDDGFILSRPEYHWRSGSFDVNFGNVKINKIWVAICRSNPGKDLYVQGNWVYDP